MPSPLLAAVQPAEQSILASILDALTYALRLVALRALWLLSASVVTESRALLEAAS